MKLVKSESIISWRELKESRALDDAEYLEWTVEVGTPPPGQILFVSHRWVTPDHPDPAGTQLQELQQRLRLLSAQEGALVFYDYCSMLQKPRTAEEDAVFERDLRTIRDLCKVAERALILSEGYADYKDRAWCFFELVIAEKNLYLFEDQRHIADHIEFRSTLGMEATDIGSKYLITGSSFSYKVDYFEVEAVVAAFQHLSSCRATHVSDLPLVRMELVRHFNARDMTAFGKLVIAIAKFFDVSMVLGTKNGLVPCKPYFDEETWIRLPGDFRNTAPRSGRFEDLDFQTRKYKPSRFAVPESMVRGLNEDGFTSMLHLTTPSVVDYVQFMKHYEQDPNWKSYYVPPLSTTILQLETDYFPSIAHVVHTMVEAIPVAVDETQGIYLPLLSYGES